MFNPDMALKWIFTCGILAYLFCLEESPVRRWIYWVIIGFLCAGVNFLFWRLLRIGIIPLLIGNVLGYMLIHGIWEFRDERLGQQQLRRFEQNRSVLVRAIMNKQEVFLRLEDGSEHRFYPEKLIGYGVSVLGIEAGEAKQYQLESIREVCLEFMVDNKVKKT